MYNIFGGLFVFLLVVLFAVLRYYYLCWWVYFQSVCVSTCYATQSFWLQIFLSLLALRLRLLLSFCFCLNVIQLNFLLQIFSFRIFVYFFVFLCLWVWMFLCYECVYDFFLSNYNRTGMKESITVSFNLYADTLVSNNLFLHQMPVCLSN